MDVPFFVRIDIISCSVEITGGVRAFTLYCSSSGLYIR